MNLLRQRIIAAAVGSEKSANASSSFLKQRLLVLQL